MAIVNLNKVTSSIGNLSRISGETWASITTTWATETRTWDAISKLIMNATKQSSSIANIAKPA